MSPASPKRIAFVVNAVGDGKLQAGPADCARVHGALTDPRKGQCDPGAATLLKDCSSFAGFQASLLATLAGWRAEDQFVFYYSGHGEEIHGHYHLVFGPGEDDRYPFNVLRSWLTSKNVRRAILLLDACHSGSALTAGTKGATPALQITTGDLPKGIVIIASSQRWERSHENPSRTLSLFTEYFLDALDTGLGGKPTLDGRISIEELVDFINSRIRSSTQLEALSQEATYTIGAADRSVWISSNINGTVQNVVPSHPPASYNSVDELRLAYDRTSSTRHPCNGVSFEDLDWDLVRKHAKAEKVDFDNLEQTNIAQKLGLLSPIPSSGKYFLHKAAVLCFCRYPGRFIPQARSVFFTGGTAEFKKASIDGPLSEQISELVTIIVQHLDKISVIGPDGLRQERLEIPMDVIREVISNAIVHRSYESSGTVQVRITTEHLETYSPGGFPPGDSWETLLEPRSGSKPKDPAIALYTTNLLGSEGIGRGFDIFREFIGTNGKDSLSCETLNGAPMVVVRIRRPQIQRGSTHGVHVSPEPIPVRQDWVRFDEAVVRDLLPKAEDSTVQAACRITSKLIDGGKLSGWDPVQVASSTAAYVWRFRERYDTFKVLGMGRPISLARVYVGFRVVPSTFLHRFADLNELEHSFNESRRQSAFNPGGDRDGIEMANDNQFLNVLGAPGSGKSTFLRRLGYESLLIDPSRTYRHLRLPVLLELRRFRSRESIDLVNEIANEFSESGFPTSRLFVEGALRNGRLLLLLDGLDEVLDSNQDELIRSIRDFIDLHGKSDPAGNRFVVSCRTAAYQNYFPRFTDVVADELNEDQVLEFSQKWFADDDGRETRRGRQFFHVLNRPENSSAFELARTPLFLSFLCSAFPHRRELPLARANLFRRALDIILRVWNAEKRIHTDRVYKDFSTELELDLLAHIAAELFRHGRFFFNRETALMAIRTFLNTEVKAPESFDASRILDVIEIQQGLILQRAQDAYSFSHLGIQEYLTAKWYWEQPGQSLKGLVMEHSWDRRWAPIFELMAGMGKADALLLEMAVWCQQNLLTVPAFEQWVHFSESIKFPEGTTPVVSKTGEFFLFLLAFTTETYLKLDAILDSAAQSGRSDSLITSVRASTEMLSLIIEISFGLAAAEVGNIIEAQRLIADFIKEIEKASLTSHGEFHWKGLRVATFQEGLLDIILGVFGRVFPPSTAIWDWVPGVRPNQAEGDESLKLSLGRPLSGVLGAIKLEKSSTFSLVLEGYRLILRCKQVSYSLSSSAWECVVAKFLTQPTGP